MRRRNTDLQARVDGDLTLEFGEVILTSYAGLELVNRYLRAMRFNDLIRTAFRGGRLGGDPGVVAMVRLLIGLFVVGGRRLDHVAYLAADPVFRRFCRLRLLSTARTVSRWLTQFTVKTVDRLQGLNAAVIAHVIPGLHLHTVTGWWSRRGCRWSGRSVDSTRIGGRSRATTPSWRTWRIDPCAITVTRRWWTSTPWASGCSCPSRTEVDAIGRRRRCIAIDGGFVDDADAD